MWGRSPLASRRRRRISGLRKQRCCDAAGSRSTAAGVAGRRRRSLAGGVFVLALALAAEGGRGFPVPKGAASDANLAGGLFLCHPLAEQLRRPRLLSSSLLSAAA